MSQDILLKRSAVAGKVPTTSQLQLGELGLNTYDGKLYAKRNQAGTETVVEIGAQYVHPASGVTAGTYKSVTVDVNGHITAGSNPTTLAGYGITDAAPSSHVGAGGSAHAAATTTVAGFMSAADKTKLDGVEAQANKYVHPASGVTAGTYKGVTVDANGHVTGGSTPTTLSGFGITDGAPLAHVGAGGSAHGLASPTVAGFMSAADKTKLDSIDPGATNYVHPASGVTAGTYKSVTVDAEGHVTAGTNPTTLAGYGIADAQPLDAELTAIAGLSTVGFVVRTGAGTAAARAIGVSGNGLSIANADGASGNPTITSNATSLNTASTVVFRDSSGNFSAGTITASLSGNASTATKLATARTISLSGDVTWSVSFDGSANVSAAATLANSGVTAGTYGSAVAIPGLTVDAKGRVTAASSNAIRTASTTQTGIVQLYSGVDSTSTTLAATASAVKTAYDLAAAAIPASQKGAANGVATLDAAGQVPASQLPSYVDDVLEVSSFASLPATGETAKLYVTVDTNKVYRWTGATYIEVSPTPGNADSATKLLNARTISMTGDGSWSVSFDGTANVSAALTLANSGVTAGTYKSVTVDAKGRVTAGSNPTTLAGYGITDAQPLDAELTAIAGLATNGIVSRTGAGAAASRSIAVSGVGLSVSNADGVAGNPTVTSNATSANTGSTIVARDSSGNFSAGTITAALAGNASTATKLATARTLSMTGDVTFTSAGFDGSANVTGTATLANSGVTAGTYKSVTVDAKGRVTAGTNPTTLAGYGITDAAPIDSPAFTGVPTCPTAPLIGGNSQQIANVAMVNAAVAEYVNTYGSPMVRQSIQYGRVDNLGYANFLEAYGDATTKHLVEFGTPVANVSLGINVFPDTVYSAATETNYWKMLNTASYDATTSKFSGGSLKLEGGSTNYVSQNGTKFNLSTLNAWTEEFWHKTSTAVVSKSIFRATDGSHGLAISTSSAGKLTLYLSSDGGNWNLANAVAGGTTLLASTWYHIALVFDGSKYTLYLNGQPEIIVNTSTRVCTINTRYFGYSSGSCQGWISDYRTSSYAVYQSAFTPPTAKFTYAVSKKVQVIADPDMPVIASFSNRAQEVRMVVDNTLMTTDLVPWNRNFVYLDYNSTTGEISIGSTPVPPQYGSLADTSNFSLLTFDNLDPVDQYGNTWLDSNVTYSAGPLAGVSNYASFNGTSSYMQSDIYALPHRFTLRAKVYFNTLPNDSACIFSFSGASGGYGMAVRIDNAKLTAYISSNGTSWNVASNSAGATTMVINTWYDVELSYDGANYKLYLNGILQNSFAASTEVTTTVNTAVYLQLGKWQTGSFLNGNIAEFELLPFVKHGDGTVVGATAFTPQSSKSSLCTQCHFFNISTMVMSSLSDSSTVPGVPPTFGNEWQRVFVGEADVNGTQVTAVRTYALNGTYVSGWFRVAASTTYVKEHNIGCDLFDIHNFSNDVPRDYKRREEVGHSNNGNTLYGAQRVTTSTTLTITTGAGISQKPFDRTSGYYSVIMRRKF